MRCLHGKQHNKYIAASTAQCTGGRCSSQLSVLDDGPCDMMNPENTEPSTAVDIKSVVQQVHDGTMRRMQRVETRFEEILLLLARIDDGSASSKMVRVLHDLTSDMYIS